MGGGFGPTGRAVPSGYERHGDMAGEDYGLGIGQIVRVDEFHLKCDIKIATGDRERLEVDLTQPMAGPRSFFGGIPEVGALVVVGFRRRMKGMHEAVILGYVPIGNKSGLRFDPFALAPPSEVDPADKALYEKRYGKTVRYKRVRGKPGDILGMSASGAEMVLSKDVKFVNRPGDMLELRDADRTLVTQALYRVHSDGATTYKSGAIRRPDLMLPAHLFEKDGKTLKSESDRYFGQDELKALLPAPYVTGGKTADFINDTEQFPPTVFANGKRTHIVGTRPAVNVEDVFNKNTALLGSGQAYTEHRTEVRHTTDLIQDVLAEIDGFTVDRDQTFVEIVFGTVVGNDPSSTEGIRHYGRVLKPRLFSTFNEGKLPRFTMQEVDRLQSPDEAETKAAAILLKLRTNKGSGEPFAAAVTKQGKLLLAVPGNADSDYGEQNVSAEMAFGGAIKTFFGASSPERISFATTMAGGIRAEIGPDANGNAVDVTYGGAVKVHYKANNNGAVASSTTVTGSAEHAVTGDHKVAVGGSMPVTVDGAYSVDSTKISLRALNEYSLNCAGYSMTILGKTQATYAQIVQETIATGGRKTDILLGAEIKTHFAGNYTHSVAAGTHTTNVVAGAYTVSVGTGAISVTTGLGAISLSTAAGAVSIGAAGGAIALTAGLAISLTSPVLIALNSINVALGAAVAPFGVVRGAPVLPLAHLRSATSSASLTWAQRPFGQFEMAVSETQMAGTLITALTAAGALGTGVPKLATGVARGIMLWLPSVTVNTLDVGTAGVGQGLAPIVIPPPLSVVSVEAGFTGALIFGLYAPLLAQGFKTGLPFAFAPAFARTDHPVVGVGTGVARFSAPPAFPFLEEGLAGAGVAGIGSAQIAKALSIALGAIFGVLTMPVAIVGPPSTSPSGGTGFGNIV